MPDAVGDDVDVLLADGVVAARVVVGRVLLAADQRRRVEQAPVRAGSAITASVRHRHPS